MTSRPSPLRRLTVSLARWFDAGAVEPPATAETDHRIDWLRCLPFFLIHLACLAVIWVGFSWTALAVAIALYVVRMFAITGFYHRYFSHRTFKTSRPFQFGMAFLGSAAVQRGPLWWAGHHRHHHNHSDDEPDRHSPRWRGFLESHVGWFMTRSAFVIPMRYVRDWARYPELRFLDRFDWFVPLLLATALFGLGVLLESAAPQLGTNGWQMLIWGFFISTVVLYHGTYTINSLAHQFGRQRYATGDDSRNSFLLALLTLGEGWHNNHHHYPAAARQGFYWWEIDITYYGLVLLARLGLIWDLRAVPRHARDRNRIDPGGVAVRVAIVGAGISGLAAAHRLGRHHDVTVFEAAGYAGGHTHTIPVTIDGEAHDVDTGFIVYNERNYPNFTALLSELGVATQSTSMSFSVRCDRTGLEYNGTSLNRLFAQRRNLLRPRFHRMLRDILRFHREAEAIAHGSDARTIGEFLDAGAYGPDFAERYLVPMGSALWSCPPGTFRGFPIQFVVDFFSNHGMLAVAGRPEWRVIRGGSRRYVEALTRSFPGRIHLGRPVHRVERHADRVELRLDDGRAAFDHVIIACHSDQALAMLDEASPVERELLGAFPYQANEVVLHTDASVLPRRRLAWASWNYRLRADASDRAVVTYNMNMLQGLDSRHVFCVTLNDASAIDPDRIIRRLTYHHPIYTRSQAAAQRRHAEVIDVNRTSFCGAYWGYGFHEDGVNSGLAVARALDARRERAA